MTNFSRTTQSHTAKAVRQDRHRKGYVLLLVLMAIIVMTLLALEFQQESVMQAQMKKHRQNLIQCDYALESGLVAAGKLIQEYNDTTITSIRKGETAASSANGDNDSKIDVDNIRTNLESLPQDELTETVIKIQELAADKNLTLSSFEMIDMDNINLDLASAALSILYMEDDPEINAIIDSIGKSPEDSGIDYTMVDQVLESIGITAQEENLTEISTIIDNYFQVADPNADPNSSTVEDTINQVKVLAEQAQNEDILSDLQLLEKTMIDDSANTAIPDEWKAHLLKEQSIEVGDASVDIYIYGENSKLPLIWALRSPIGTRTPTENDYNMPLVASLIDKIDPGNTHKREIIDYLAELTDGVDIEFSPGVYKSGDIWRERRTAITKIMQDAAVSLNHINFTQVGGQWHRDVNNPHFEEIKEIVTLPNGNLISDYLGLWGTTYININTAPAEVLEVALKDVGVTPELAQKIVEYRETKSMFLTYIRISEVDGIDRNMAKAIGELTKTIDRVFTVRVVAKIGDITRTKQACYHRRGNKLLLQAVF